VNRKTAIIIFHICQFRIRLYVGIR
jgi:hypothetical protein